MITGEIVRGDQFSATAARAERTSLTAQRMEPGLFGEEVRTGTSGVAPRRPREERGQQRPVQQRPHRASKDETLVGTLSHQRHDDDRPDDRGVRDDGVGRPNPHSSHYRQPTERAEETTLVCDRLTSSSCRRCWST